MPTIATADQFLGSLVGAYIGHYYPEQHHGNWPSVSQSLLYQSWLANTSHDNIPAPSEVNLATALPWLLYRHDDSSSRLHWLNQTLASPTRDRGNTISDITGTIYILGNCLEWLMQCSLNTPNLHLRLSQHLRQKQSNYPVAVSPQITRLIKELETHSSNISPQTIYAQPVPPIALALRCCLNYRENLVLALDRSGMIGSTPTMIGCLLGAWRGPSVIPIRLLMGLTKDSRNSLGDIAQRLYHSWAGISQGGTTSEIFPLDF